MNNNPAQAKLGRGTLASDIAFPGLEKRRDLGHPATHTKSPQLSRAHLLTLYFKTIVYIHNCRHKMFHVEHFGKFRPRYSDGVASLSC